MDFASRLAEDLKGQGSLVFFDRKSIQIGWNFDVQIERGIHQAAVFAAILTPHAVRDQSICRDEIALAHNENKQIVPLRANENPRLPVPLLLVRRNWIDFSRDYQAGLDALVRFLHGDESGLLPPTLQMITGVVPLDFAPEIARFSTGFTGRDWLAPEIDRWLTTTDKRAMILLAEPGFGKSAIAAWITKRWQSQVVGVHFCTQGDSRTRDPYEFVANLVGQLDGTLPGFGEAVTEHYPEQRRKTAGDAFRELIVEVVRKLPAPGHPHLIVVDSLDESLAQPGEKILDVLIEHAGDLPPWLRLIATSRPEEEVMRRIPALSGLELNCERPDNLADVSAYILSRLSSGQLAAGTGAGAEIKEQLEKLSAGNFLYAKMALDALADGAMTAEDINHLAPGLVQVFREMFRRRFPDPGLYQQAHASLLRALVAARSPLSFALLHEVAGGEAETVFDRLDELRSCLRVTGRGENASYSIFHRSLADWLADREAAGRYWCRIKGGHEALAQIGWRRFEANSLAADDYFVRYLSDHLLGAEQWDRLARLLTDLPLLNLIHEQHRTHEWMRLWRTMADRVDPVGGYRQALEHFKSDGAKGPRIATAAEHIGTLLRELGYPEAVEFAEEAVKAWEPAAGSEMVPDGPGIGVCAMSAAYSGYSGGSDELASSLRNLAEAWRFQKEFDKALPVYRRALEIWKRLHTEQSAEVATIYHDFAEFYRDKGELSTAIDYNQRAMAIREKLVPVDLAALADCVNDTGVMLWESSRDQKALEYYGRALALFRRAYPSGEHYDIATVLSNIADFRESADLEAAVLQQEKALKMALLFRPFHFRHCRNIRAKIVSGFTALEKYDRAAEYQRESVRCADLLAASGTAERVNERRRLLHLMRMAGMTEQARRVHEEILELIGMPADAAMAAAARDQDVEMQELPLREQAFKYFQSGDYPRAEQVLRFMIAQDCEVQGTRVHLVRVLLLQDRADEARIEVEAALKDRANGEQPYVLQRVLFLRLLLALLAGEPAQQHLQALRSELEDSGAFMHWEVAALLDHVRPRLADAANALLAELAQAINDPEARAKPSQAPKEAPGQGR
jgi:tetratricopeptide (TPR) repeat protein